MSNLAVQLNMKNESNVIPFIVVDNDNIVVEDVKEQHPLAGKSCEVYAFRTMEEIAAMIAVFDKHIDEAENDNQRQIAYRNKMLFVIGINVGVRASDLRELRWSFFFNEDGSRKDFYKIQPKKTRKQKKFVTLYFNNAVWAIIDAYLEEYPFNSINDYLFASRKGDKPICVDSLCRIIKDTACEAGINQNIGSHSLRKTFGFWIWHESNDKNKALVILCNIFNHSSVQVTMKYIGLMNVEIEDTFNNLNLGIDLI
jgi:integrase